MSVNEPNRTPPPGPVLPRVLIVDDEPSVRMITRLFLEAAGYAVADAGDAGEALVWVRGAERPFGAILLDLTLPDRSGTDLLPELRALSPGARVILVSGQPEENVPDHGADIYLPKPFTREQLLAALRAVTATPQP